MRNIGRILLNIVKILFVFILLDSNFTMGLLTGVSIRLMLGWYGFINKTLENIHIDNSFLTLAALFFSLLVFSVHTFVKWLYQHYQQKNWKLSWTVSGIMMLLLMACVSISSILTIHHLLWLKRDRLTFSDFEIRMFFSKIDALIDPIKKSITESYANNSQAQNLLLWKSQLPNDNDLKEAGIKKIDIDNQGGISIFFDDNRFYVANKLLQFIPKPAINTKQPIEWICKTDIETSYRRYKKGGCEMPIK